MLRKIISIVCIAMGILCLCGCKTSDADVPENVVAEYRGEYITKEVVQQNIEMFTFASGSQVCPTEEDMLEEILTNTILFYEAERRGLTATEEEIQTMLDMTARAYEMPETKTQLEAYFEQYDWTYDEYIEVLKTEQLPRTIARQKLRYAVGQEYCEKHGLEFTNVNPPKEMTEAIDKYIEKLVNSEKKNVVYYEN